MMDDGILPPVFCLLSSVFCLLSFVFCLLSPVSCLLSPVPVPMMCMYMTCMMYDVPMGLLFFMHICTSENMTLLLYMLQL